MYNNLLKRIHFPSLSIYFFPSPNPNFGASWKKMGIFSILKIESFFPSLFIYFFPHFCPSPNPNFGVSWAKMGLDPPANQWQFTIYHVANVGRARPILARRLTHSTRDFATQEQVICTLTMLIVLFMVMWHRRVTRNVVSSSKMPKSLKLGNGMNKYVLLNQYC